MTDPSVPPQKHPVADPPQPTANWALFLDLDGTLLDIAPAPDAVAVPEGLVEDLGAVSRALHGALAIVSGRPLGEVDRLLAPLKIPAAGEHGAVIRLPNGVCEEMDGKIPPEWVEALLAASVRMPGVLIERKAHSVVAHYRGAPNHEDELRQIASRLAGSVPEHFEVLEAKMAFEIRSRDITKGRAVERLMQCEPFRGRMPVFVGDDVTDHDGFRAAEAMGGLAVDVFQRFAGRPKEVRDWLKQVARV
ncbi:MAG: trehalose-phosphatase [Alphaproteobacteria bacterium]|nr:trehalose-phosphatase [Alphaproteobacteria bacterium]